MSSSPAPTSPLQRFLNTVERTGNALPHPATLFALLAALVVLLSWICHTLGVSVTNPASGKVVTVINLLSAEGIQRMILELPRNFLAYPPLGISLTCMLGIGIAEYTGLMGAMLRLIVLNSPARLITPMVVFSGVMSNAGSEVGYVLLIPLAAALYHTLGRHPFLGLAAAFAGVSGGYSANLIVGSVDVLLAGLSEAAAHIVDPTYTVDAFSNWYFMMVSTFFITAAGTWVTEKIVAPRLGEYRGETKRDELKPLSAQEKRGLWAALAVTAGLTGLVLWGTLAPGGFLIDPKNPSFLESYFIRGLIFFIFVYGLLPGIAYGVAARTVRNDHDIMGGMTTTMKSMASFIVLAFFAAQFISYFNWTNLGIITAVSGAEFIQHLGLESMPLPLMLALVLFAATVNLLISSASAKWALLAPVFVPMFMLLGYSPELVQGAFRVGDSCTNIITPLLSYFPLILTFAQKYDPRAGIGTLIATMLPYSLCFLVVWTLLLMAWIALGVPMGPGAPLLLGK
ncbi:p-aminobenzoyl-glutamate transport protein [Lacunisphaera limnophila]|uniref:p-aminobenzoyl-glutamate transport protein n=1 Tax=Lacunisphaera limnophila TaxID=1838286 RepID=A0A1D8AS87_9BACT|nr:AbgT family transporter [Lacunisphaera limnophila]AOS43754.1 p-aminobenzoyl-glutamate transport protein [Lacunisphaera limnophila]